MHVYRPPKLCPDEVTVPGDDLSSLIVTKEAYAKMYEAGRLQGHKVNPELTVFATKTSDTTTGGQVVDVEELD